MQSLQGRENRVSELFLVLRHRGPGALDDFHEEVIKEHPWLGELLTTTRKESSHLETTMDELVNLFNRDLIPLVYADEISNRVSKSTTENIVDKLRRVFRDLDQGIRRAIHDPVNEKVRQLAGLVREATARACDVNEVPKRKPREPRTVQFLNDTPHVETDKKKKVDKQPAATMNKRVNELVKENARLKRDLMKFQKEAKVMKTENDKLRNDKLNLESEIHSITFT